MSEQRKRLLISTTITSLVWYSITRTIIFQANKLSGPGVTTCMAQVWQRISYALPTKLPSFRKALNIGGDHGRFVP